MVGFYKHDIPAWMDGTEGLSDGAYRVYHVIVQLIMLNEGPIARNDRGIAGRCNQTVKAFGRHLDELISIGKLTLEGDRIGNARASIELGFVLKNRENAGKGGKTRAERHNSQKNETAAPSKPLKNNDQPQATLQNLSSLKEKRREDTPKVPKGTEPDGFAAWWEVYPQRDGANPRAAALQRYEQALKAGATPDMLMRAIRAYAAELQRTGKLGTEYVKQAQFFLSPRERRWEDYARQADSRCASPAANLGDAYLASLSDDRWRDEVKRWADRRGYWPLQNRTAPPDDPRTKVPSHILAEMSIHPARARAA